MEKIHKKETNPEIYSEFVCSLKGPVAVLFILYKEMVPAEGLLRRTTDLFSFFSFYLRTVFVFAFHEQTLGCGFLYSLSHFLSMNYSRGREKGR